MKFEGNGKKILLAAIAAGILAGCSPRQEAPATPVMVATTPTYRTSVDAGDAVTEPYYLTPGVNGGDKAKAPSVPMPDRYSANSPLAVEVYFALTSDPTLDMQYVAVEGKPHSILLKGTVNSAAQRAAIERAALTARGVKTVKNELAVQAG